MPPLPLPLKPNCAKPLLASSVMLLADNVRSPPALPTATPPEAPLPPIVMSLFECILIAPEPAFCTEASKMMAPPFEKLSVLPLL